MAEPNYARNIIANLADLPEFLRKPILQKRLTEFFFMSEQDKREIIINALEAGPTIQFRKFSTIFKTWLEILCNFSEEQRTIMFSTYFNEIIAHPQKIILFNLDGILEIYLSLTEEQKNTLSGTIKKITNALDDGLKKRLQLLIPERAKMEIGL